MKHIMQNRFFWLFLVVLFVRIWLAGGVASLFRRRL